MDNQEIEIELYEEPQEIELENSDVVVRLEENVIESISVNGAEQEVDENKNVDISVPTKLSDLTNDNNTVQDSNYVHTDNNYSNEDKNKLASLENYDDTDIKADISDLQDDVSNLNTDITDLNTNKADKSEIPTKTSDLNNDSGYVNETQMSNAIQTETTNRQNVDINLQGQIDAITVSSDVVDIVGTYTELQNYDTTKLTNDDLIKVLQDSTHNDAMSYYRWVITNNIGAWSYVGSEGPFYTKSENDEKLQDYVKNTDYATAGKGGVVRSGNQNFGVDTNNGSPFVYSRNYTTYKGQNDTSFIGKGTLESVINNSIILKGTTAPTTETVGYRVGQLYLNTTDNKVYQLTAIDTTNNTYTWQQLIRDTDYATYSKGGVIRTGGYCTGITDGLLRASARSYQEYLSEGQSSFISKGTLENVITGKELVNQTTLDESQAEQDTQIQANTESIENIENNLIPTGTAEGEEITINDSAKYKFKEFNIGGNTFQQTYTGKNLFNTAKTYISQLQVGNTRYEKIPNGIREIQIGNSSSYNARKFVIMDLSNYVGKTVRMKCKFVASGNNSGRFELGVSTSAGYATTIKGYTNTSGDIISFVVPEFENTSTYLSISLYSNTTTGTALEGDYVDYTDIIITIDNEDMTYEPYVRRNSKP